MGYQLRWHTPNKALLLTIEGEYTLENAREVNRMVTHELDQSSIPLAILIDAIRMNRPYNFHDMRAVQTYMDHRQLKHIYVATNDRLVKLAMMVIFNLSRAHLHLFDDVDKAQWILQRYIGTQTQ